MAYVDVFLIPVPKANLAAYEAMSNQFADTWRKHGATSYVDPGYATFTQLGGYYARSTDATVKAAAVKKIADYYTATIKPHAVHDKVFRYWIHRGINKMSMGALCGDVNDKLGKIVDLRITKLLDAA